MVFLPDGLWGLAAPVRAAWSAAWRVPCRRCRCCPNPWGRRRRRCCGSRGWPSIFGGLKALDGVDIAVRRGTVHALIGPNGSGKSTFINVLTGLYRPTAGRIAFAGDGHHRRCAPHRRTRAGLARTFQNIRVFRGMTVLENVIVGAERPWQRRRRAAWPGGGAGAGGAGVRRGGAGTRCGRSVSCPTAISAMWRTPGRWPAIPVVLLLDEPGCRAEHDGEGRTGRACCAEMKGHGLTILIVEHDMNFGRVGGRPHHRAQFRPPYRRWPAADRAAASRT